MERASGVQYIPKWTELVITAAMIAAGFALFRLAAKHLPVFPQEEHHQATPVTVATTTTAGSSGDWSPVLARGD